ncbi:MAG TPA: primosomal protein N' [Pirellulales bacterium]|nr:primosomal protein N' [Pirellulales bacterium]
MSEQQSLFETEPPAWEQDDESEQLVARVVFATGPEQPFDYLVPERLRTRAELGRRVRVPLGKSDRLMTGYLVGLSPRQIDPDRLKPLAQVVDERSLLGPSMLRLTEWMADYYLCPWGQVLEAVVPAGVRWQAGTREKLFVQLAADAEARLATLKLSAKQREIIELMAAAAGPLDPVKVARTVGCTQAPINLLRKRGVLVSETRRTATAAPTDRAERLDEHFTLNADQRAALDTILAALESRQASTVLLHGVTGSGKTEVYIQAIDEVLRYGRQAIVLVPEISLTPQTEGRFRARFGRVAVLHSHQSDAERHRHWQQIAAGEVRVVVGARSAVFAPTPHLGLIVLDEEHEASFKQDSAPRYHARDVALARSRLEQIPLVLGSATPSLESWQRAQEGTFRLVSLPQRVFDRPLPNVGTIDLRLEFQNRHSRGAVSRQLHIAMDEALKNDGQVILLLNRRGYSTHIQCQACGHVVRCPECSIALTHHLSGQMAVCHYCDFQMPPPAACPECRSPGIRYSGLGTQRLEAEVKARFPGFRSLRMDTDTMQKPGSHQRALAAFHSGEVRILLGTQMIAKGLDFPNVTLVGVINADTALHLPDFRAAERTFQLVTQVAGRTGRGPRGGRVLVQTFSPDHPAIQAAVRHDYEAFARGELPTRSALGYPPFASMIRLVVRGPVEAVAEAFAQSLGQRLRDAAARHATTARVLGPAPAPIAKLRGKHRFQLQTQSADGAALRQIVVDATAGLKPAEDVQWIADVDPIDML